MILTMCTMNKTTHYIMFFSNICACNYVFFLESNTIKTSKIDTTI